MRTLAAFALLAVCPAAALAQDAPLSVPIVGVGGKPAGTLELTDTPHGVLLVASFEAGILPAGEHAIHFHTTGDCSDTEAFEKAGDHYNPAEAEHGYLHEKGPHTGDMPNFTVVEGAPATVSEFDPMVRLSEGDAPLLDDGTALVVHAAGDDYTSQPAGDAGDRIACAEIKGLLMP